MTSRIAVVLAAALTLGACAFWRGTVVVVADWYVEQVDARLAEADCEPLPGAEDLDGPTAHGCGTLLNVSPDTDRYEIIEVPKENWGWMYFGGYDDPDGVGLSMLIDWAIDAQCESFGKYLASDAFEAGGYGDCESWLPMD